MKLAINKFSSQSRFADHFGDGSFVSWIEAPIQHRPGDCPIHCARIHVNKTEPSREGARHAAFPRSGRTVDGNYAMSILCWHVCARDQRSFSRETRRSKRAIYSSA